MISHRRITVLVLCLGVALLAMVPGFRPASASLALLTKVVQDVTKKAGAAEWKRAAQGEVLSSGDQIRTGVQSLAIIKFLDNTIVRVRERSELTVKRELSGSMPIKTIQTSSGAYGFDIKKQQNEQFRLTSPTSVASIRGTTGSWTSGDGNDTCVLNTGSTSMNNTVSGDSVLLNGGDIGFSNADGSISSRKATGDELNRSLTLIGSGSPNELKLKLRNQQGEEKELKLKFKK